MHGFGETYIAPATFIPATGKRSIVTRFSAGPQRLLANRGEKRAVVCAEFGGDKSGRSVLEATVYDTAPDSGKTAAQVIEDGYEVPLACLFRLE